MKRDKYGTGQDPYCYPGTHVLRNLLDLRDDAELANAELALSTEAAKHVEFVPAPYTLDTLRTLHRNLFGRIYEWAGELRAVDIAKDSTRFPKRHRPASWKCVAPACRYRRRRVRRSGHRRPE